MTASITGRKRCSCGQYKTPLANGTMPRHRLKIYHTRSDVINETPEYRHCHNSGKFPPATVTERKKKFAKSHWQITDRPVKVRGGRRARKVGTKSRKVAS